MRSRYGVGYAAGVGGFSTASLQVNFHLISKTDAAASMRLFVQEVIPKFEGYKDC